MVHWPGFILPGLAPASGGSGVANPVRMTPGQSTIEVASRERRTVVITASPQGRGGIKADATASSIAWHGFISWEPL